MRAFAFAVIGTVCLAGQAAAAGWGSAEGQFVLKGDVPNVPAITPNTSGGCPVPSLPDDSLLFDSETKGIANIFVYLRRKPDIHPDLKESPESEIVFDQQSCRFMPHCLVVRTDQSVLCKNSDALAHNVHTNPFANRAENFTVPGNDQKGQSVKMPVVESLPVKVVCDIHSHMVAWWVVVDHPYATVTDEQGRFKIENLPEGTHEFTVWHEKAGYLDRKFKITIKDGETTQLEAVEVPFDKFKK